jgi:hypothetical protein
MGENWTVFEHKNGFCHISEEFFTNATKIFQPPVALRNSEAFDPIVARRASDKYECIIYSGDVY